ncbi:hypothetical protein G9A89_001354 [Geosiphon pyriformis]|nr:hypothetical protein G9A89_001354 [Geosiphon pyriformis]
MSEINFDELHCVITNFPDKKAAGLSDISNELWKHCDKLVLGLLLVLLNSYLFCELVSGLWKEAWVLMIPKPYEWKGVLTNIHSIALIKTAHKILSKIFSNRILLACSSYDVLCGDNFSVLKGTTTQSLIFVVGLVIEDALEKNQKFWLVLQNMQKVYDLVGWKHLEKAWSRSKCVAGFSTFLAAGVFVNDTFWVDSSQAVTQHILNIASEFFQVNNISINNDKTVAISINSKVGVPSLFISGLPISIVRRGESHQYFGIFLSTEGLLRPSLTKAHLDIHFFTNLVLRKAVLDKQFLYLVSAVFHFIIGYRTQFGNIPVSVSDKWDALIYKGLKLKAGLPIDFPSNTIHHPSFYGLKSFSQCQSEISVGAGSLNFCESDNFVAACGRLSQVDINSLFVYMDGSLKNLDTVDCKAGAAVFFEDIDLGLGVSVQDLVSSILAELQAIALALKCGHFSISGNDCADSIADATSLSSWYLLPRMDGHFLLADGGVVSALHHRLPVAV